MDKPAPER